jgi:hypothetical protein
MDISSNLELLFQFTLTEKIFGLKFNLSGTNSAKLEYKVNASITMGGLNVSIPSSACNAQCHSILPSSQIYNYSRLPLSVLRAYYAEQTHVAVKSGDKANCIVPMEQH